ncbi:MAG: 4-alpha-glucanotransferase [Gallionella sp.]|nr:4-alpha-glucanotransferase [Gallionella sp.]
MLTQRASGILLHPTSLPGTFGSGDLGEHAYRFVDWLKAAGQTYWQTLPIGEIGPGNSPYMSSSAFAGNVLMVDLAELGRQGWLSPGDLIPHPQFKENQVDYALTKSFRLRRLRLAALRFTANSSEVMRQAFSNFCEEEQDWLDDYALFMAIAEQQSWREWQQWPQALVRREDQALRQIEIDCAEDIVFWKFCQWSFSRQWLGLKSYARDRGVHLIGDVPIFVALQSADVWAHQSLFELDESGQPLVVAGVPPDYFSETGQLWGNPLYRWSEHEKNGYRWWIYRIKKSLQYTDLLRIDHFRGFAAYWQIQADAPNAIHGQWMLGPSEKLFYALEKAIPHLPIIAEDLGIITPDVVELRDKFGLPGMRILQFAFGEDESNHYLPHHYVANAVAYTGTHDNDTSKGWWNTISDHEREFAKRYLSCDGQHIQWDMIQALSKSIANTVIYPMQDVLGLGGDSRMNYPGLADGNWEWRFTWEQIQLDQTETLAKLSAENHRLCQTVSNTFQ